jgi:hypothetical protein
MWVQCVAQQLNSTGEAMKQDIQQTKMDNEYKNLLDKIQELMLRHAQKHGAEHFGYALQQLSIEMAARHLATLNSFSNEAQQEEGYMTFLKDVGLRTGFLQQMINHSIDIKDIK